MKMILCRSPYRISFFGGGTDYEEWFKINGGEFLSTAINQYCYSMINIRENSKKTNYRILWKKIEEVSKIEKIQQPIVRESIKMINLKKSSGEYIYIGDLPAKSGLGSSSAYAVSVIHSLLSLKNKPISKYLLANLAYKLERKFLKENIGIQDSIASSFGGLNYVQIPKNGKYVISPILLEENVKKSLFKRILLVFSEEQRKASDMAFKTIRAMKKKAKDFSEIQKMPSIAKNLLLDKKLDSFGELLMENWKIKANLDPSIATKNVKEITGVAKVHGAIGFKLLGAGGGGFILIYFKENEKQNFKKKFKDKLFIVDPKLDNEGTKILLNSSKRE